MPTSGRATSRAWLLVLHDLGLDDLVICLGLAGRLAGRLSAALGLSLRVDGGAHLLARLGGLLRGGPDPLGVSAFQRLLQLGHRPPDLTLPVPTPLPPLPAH